MAVLIKFVPPVATFFPPVDDLVLGRIRVALLILTRETPVSFSLLSYFNLKNEPGPRGKEGICFGSSSVMYGA
jgi:hypothetical protein